MVEIDAKGWRNVTMQCRQRIAELRRKLTRGLCLVNPFEHEIGRPFTFRLVAGLLLNALYLLRGFGITAWTHALYDVLLVVSGGF